MPRMPDFFQDLINFLFAVAPYAAGLALLLAGMSLHRDGGHVAAGGGFTRWMFWAVMLLVLPSALRIFQTLPEIGVYVPNFGSGTPPASWTSNLLKALHNGFATFVKDYLIAHFAPVAAAYFLINGILNLAGGRSPLISILIALFLLTLASTHAFLATLADSGPKDGWDVIYMLEQIWNYLASVIMPIGAGLATIGVILNFIQQKPLMPLVLSAIAFLTVSSLWNLLNALI
jgi:hypothetical protein